MNWLPLVERIAARVAPQYRQRYSPLIDVVRAASEYGPHGERTLAQAAGLTRYRVRRILGRTS